MGALHPLLPVVMADIT